LLDEVVDGIDEATGETSVARCELSEGSNEGVERSYDNVEARECRGVVEMGTVVFEYGARLMLGPSNTRHAWDPTSTTWAVSSSSSSRERRDPQQDQPPSTEHGAPLLRNNERDESESHSQRDGTKGEL